MRFLKFICALPCYAVAVFAAMFMMLAAKGIDKLYPETKTSVTFMRTLMGFNASPVDMSSVAPPLATGRLSGPRIYK